MIIHTGGLIIFRENCSPFLLHLRPYDYMSSETLDVSVLASGSVMDVMDIAVETETYRYPGHGL